MGHTVSIKVTGCLCVLKSNLYSWVKYFDFRSGNPQLAMRFTPARMNSQLRMARSSNYPAIPNSLLHLGVLLGLPNMRQVCRTVDGLDYIYQGVVGCQQNKTVALVFVSGRMLELLSTRESIHADGTFKKRSRKPKMAQIFNIVTKYGNNVRSYNVIFHFILFYLMGKM